jgi:Large polyvalent protein-associated domain 7
MPEPNDSPIGTTPTLDEESPSSAPRFSRKARGRAGWLPHPEGPTNSVSSPNARAPAVEQAKPPPETKSTPPKSGSSTFDPNSIVPQHISDKYLRVGSQYYFQDRDPAFRVGVTRTTTKLDSPEVVRDILEIEHARANGQPLELKGSQKFRREAWHQATLLEIETRGYRPSKVEKAQVEREQVALAAMAKGAGTSASFDTPSAAQAAARDTDPVTHASPSRARGEREPPVPLELQTVRGRLVDHGAAPREHDRHAPTSYYIKIETAKGETNTIWGDDLPRALQKSLSRVKVGDHITAKYVGDLAVTTTARGRDDRGEIVRREDVQEIRNRWIVETQRFLQDREALAKLVRDPTTKPQEAVQQHPSLAGAFATIHVSEMMAKEYQDLSARRRFLETVRQGIANEIARGEQLPVAQVFRVKGDEQRRPRDRTQERVLG